MCVKYALFLATKCKYQEKEWLKLFFYCFYLEISKFAKENFCKGIVKKVQSKKLMKELIAMYLKFLDM